MAIYTGGILGVDEHFTRFRLSASHTGNTIPLTNWEAPDATLEPAGVGSLVTVSTGVFTFPLTGFWYIDYHTHFQATVGENSAFLYTYMQFTEDNGSNWATQNECATNMRPDDYGGTIQASAQGGILFDCVATATHKVQQGFTTQDSGVEARGDTNKTFSWISFRRVANT